MKRFLSCILLFVFCLTLVGCKPKPQPTPVLNEVPEELSKELIEIDFWHAMGQENQVLIAKIIDNFEREYQAMGYNIKVTQTPLGGYETLRDAITSNIAAGQQPTLAQTYPDHVALYMAGDAVRELDSYNESKWGLGDEEAQYVDGFFAEGKIYDDAGTLYSLPFNKSTEVMFYNKTMFDKYKWDVPTTWDEVVEVAEAFKQTTEYQELAKAGQPVAGFSYDSESNLFITFTQQWGGEYTGLTNSTGTGSELTSSVGGSGWLLFNNSKSKEALKFYYDNYKAGNMVTSTFFGADYSSDAFKNGQCVMTLGSSAGAKHNNPQGAFEVAAAICPQKDPNNPQVIQQGTNVSLFKCADAQEELAGWLFMKYLTNYESALIWVTGFEEYTNLAGELIEGADGTPYFPIRKDVYNSEAYRSYMNYQKTDENGNLVKDPEQWTIAKESAIVGLGQADSFYTNVAFDGSSIVRDEVGFLVQRVLYNDHSGKNFDEVLDSLYKDTIRTIIYG